MSSTGIAQLSAPHVVHQRPGRYLCVLTDPHPPCPMRRFECFSDQAFGEGVEPSRDFTPTSRPPGVTTANQLPFLTEENRAQRGSFRPRYWSFPADTVKASDGHSRDAGGVRARGCGTNPTASEEAGLGIPVARLPASTGDVRLLGLLRAVTLGCRCYPSGR